MTVNPIASTPALAAPMPLPPRFGPGAQRQATREHAKAGALLLVYKGAPLPTITRQVLRRTMREENAALQAEKTSRYAVPSPFGNRARRRKRAHDRRLETRQEERKMAAVGLAA